MFIVRKSENGLFSVVDNSNNRVISDSIDSLYKAIDIMNKAEAVKKALVFTMYSKHCNVRDYISVEEMLFHNKQ